MSVCDCVIYESYEFSNLPQVVSMLPPLFLGANLDSLRCRVATGSADRWTVGSLGVEPHHTVLDLCAVPHKPSLWESWTDEGFLLQLWGSRFFFFKLCICMNWTHFHWQFHLWQLSSVQKCLPDPFLPFQVASGAWLEDFPNAGGKPTCVFNKHLETGNIRSLTNILTNIGNLEVWKETSDISPGHALATSRKRSPSKWFCLELGIGMSFELLSVVKGWGKRIA